MNLSQRERVGEGKRERESDGIERHRDLKTDGRDIYTER